MTSHIVVTYTLFQSIKTNLWLSGKGKSNKVVWLGFKSSRVLELSAALLPFCVLSKSED